MSSHDDAQPPSVRHLDAVGVARVLPSFRASLHGRAAESSAEDSRPPPSSEIPSAPFLKAR